MNSEAYIVNYWNGQINLYPSNISTGILSDVFEAVPREENINECLIIKRTGDMVYYAFVETLDGSQENMIGIMVSLNNVLIDDILALNTFMCYMFGNLAGQYALANYDRDKRRYYLTNDDCRPPNLSEAREMLRERFNERFEGFGTCLGPKDYASRQYVDRFNLYQDGSVQRFGSSSIRSNSITMRESVNAGNIIIVSERENTKNKLEKIVNNTEATDRANDMVKRMTADLNGMDYDSWTYVVPVLVAIGTILVVVVVNLVF